MQGVSQPDDRKKSVVRGLTGLLRVSPISADVDPKNFFMMVNSNFSILAQGDRLDLTPLWDALAPRARSEDLTPLFLKFEEKAAQLGFEAVLPPPVAELDAEARAAGLEHFERSQGGTPLPQLEPVFQETGDLHRRVLQGVVHGFRASPVGQRIDSSKLNYFIGERLAELFDGKTFDATPVVQALREQGIEDPDIFLGIAAAQDRLKTMDVVLPEPVLNVSSDLKADLLRRSKSQDLTPGPSERRKEPEKAPEPKANVQQRLKDLGLGQNTEESKRRNRRIRLGILSLCCVVGLVALVMLRPNRMLSTNPFEGTLPLTEARLVDRAFLGILDTKAWDAMSPQERETRFERFKATVKSKGLHRDLQVRGPQGDLLIVSNQKGIRAAPALIEKGSRAVTGR